jgi:hypothetical protein
MAALGRRCSINEKMLGIEVYREAISNSRKMKAKVNIKEVMQ